MKIHPFQKSFHFFFSQLVLFAFILSFVTFLGSLQADVNKDMNELFKKLGTASNISRPGAYEDQTAGFYTGGNLFARNQIRNTQFATIQLPDYRVGCGGIDMFMGAFSHISGTQLVEVLKAIGSNLSSYALLLAIETMSPIVKNNITELNDLVQKINQSNINSCEIAATTLGAVWPKSNTSKAHLCQMIGTDKKYGGFSDYAAARQGCGAEHKRDQIIDAAQEDPRFQKMLGTEFNLAWKALQENAFLLSDKELAEFFMSLSGTIISKKEGGDSYSITTRPSLADDDMLLAALLHGGQVEIYRCTDSQEIKSQGNKCLDVQKTEMKFDAKNSLIERVKAILLSIENKIYTDQALSPQEIAFLNSTRLPFYKIINVATAYRRGSAPVEVVDYAELGAIDILFQYLSEVLDIIHESVDHIKLVQLSPEEINEFQKSLQLARQRVIERRMGSFKQIEQVISIVHKTELLEKNLMNKVGSIMAEEL